jgi:hypothetical protein
VWKETRSRRGILFRLRQQVETNRSAERNTQSQQSAAQDPPDLFKQIYARLATEHPNSKKMITLGGSNIFIGIINIWLARYIPNSFTGTGVGWQQLLPRVVRDGTFTYMLTTLGVFAIIAGLMYLFYHNRPDTKGLVLTAVMVFLLSIVFAIGSAYPLATANIQGGWWFWLLVFEPAFYIGDIFKLNKLRK